MYQHTTGETLDTGGQWCKVPSHYHCIVDSIEMEPKDKQGNLMVNLAFEVTAKILAGIAPNQEDKLMDLRFNAPQTSHKDGGEFARKIIDRMLYATGLMSTDDVGGKQLAIDWESMVGQQFVVGVKLSDKGYIQLDGSEIYHVDDPEVAHVPKNEQLLKLIPASRRRIGDKPAAPSTPAPVSNVDMMNL